MARIYKYTDLRSSVMNITKLV
ncbi:Protein of unknown function [Pyronema omphalodes CBS 100304]|uniref:Uncharacterized protein n=1 Tax=Pyronema omphalodes (strain CBS 100304) TaxID=1076935 RepID=U4LRT1_PYROM|nr:Protein of unknown function [Pyronema omphalodes CBS 100304]